MDRQKNDAPAEAFGDLLETLTLGDAVSGLRIQNHCAYFVQDVGKRRRN
jgi:hypothetical protein